MRLYLVRYYLQITYLTLLTLLHPAQTLALALRQLQHPQTMPQQPKAHWLIVLHNRVTCPL